MKKLSQGWQYAAVGVLAAATVEMVAHAPRPRARVWVPLILAGATGVLYGNLIPRGEWGARSGAAFAQTSVMTHLHRHWAATDPLQLTAWGALTGWALRRLAEM